MLDKHWKDLASSGLPFDLVIRTVSVNGVEIPELMTGAVGMRMPDGSVREQEHTPKVYIRDGTIMNDIGESVRCDICAVEVDDEAARGGMSPLQILVASRHHPQNIERSALSGIPLCYRHRVRVPIGDGALVAISQYEHRDLAHRFSTNTAMIEHLRCFVRPGGHRALP